MRTFDDAHTASAASLASALALRPDRGVVDRVPGWGNRPLTLHPRPRLVRLRTPSRPLDPLPPCGRQATRLPRIGAPSIDSAPFGSARSALPSIRLSALVEPCRTPRTDLAAGARLPRFPSYGAFTSVSPSAGAPAPVRHASLSRAGLDSRDSRVSREQTSRTLPVDLCSSYDPRPRPLMLRAPLTAGQSPDSAALRGRAAESGGHSPNAVPAGFHSGQERLPCGPRDSPGDRSPTGRLSLPG